MIMPDPNELLNVGEAGTANAGAGETPPTPPVSEGGEAIDPALTAWRGLPPEVAQKIYNEIQKETVMALHERGALRPPEEVAKGSKPTAPQPDPVEPEAPKQDPNALIRKQLEKELGASFADLESGKKGIREVITEATLAGIRLGTGVSTSLTQKQIKEATAGLEKVAYEQKKNQFYQANPDIAEFADVINGLIEAEGGPNAVSIAQAIREVNRRQADRRQKEEKALARKEPDAYGGRHLETPRGRVAPGSEDIDLDELEDQIMDAHKRGDKAKYQKLMAKWEMAVPR